VAKLGGCTGRWHYLSVSYFRGFMGFLVFHMNKLSTKFLKNQYYRNIR